MDRIQLLDLLHDAVNQMDDAALARLVHQAQPGFALEETGELPGILCYHRSLARPETEIRAEIGVGGPYFVRTRTAGVVTYEEPCPTNTRARERFEKVVEEHYGQARS